jgi:hypothetical protein
LQGLQDPGQINGDGLNSARREASRHFRSKRKECLKDRTNELATNSKNKNTRGLYRGINEFKSYYQSRSNAVKDENGDLHADSHDILNSWKNYFSQLFNVHSVSDVRQTEIHIAAILVSDPSPLGLKLLLQRKSINRQVVMKLRQNCFRHEGKHCCPKIHKLIHSIWNKEKVSDQWKESIIIPIQERTIKPNAIIVMGYHCYQLHRQFYRISSS